MLTVTVNVWLLVVVWSQAPTNISMHAPTKISPHYFACEDGWLFLVHLSHGYFLTNVSLFVERHSTVAKTILYIGIS